MTEEIKKGDIVSLGGFFFGVVVGVYASKDGKNVYDIRLAKDALMGRGSELHHADNIAGKIRKATRTELDNHVATLLEKQFERLKEMYLALAINKDS